MRCDRAPSAGDDRLHLRPRGAQILPIRDPGNQNDTGNQNKVFGNHFLGKAKKINQFKNFHVEDVFATQVKLINFF